MTKGSATSLDVTIHNGGGVATGTLSRTFTGMNAGAFSTMNDHCSSSMLAAGGSCTLTVVFAPTSTGDMTASLSVGDGNKSAQVPLSGVSVTPGALTLSPTPSVGFGTVSVGSTTSQSLMVSNGGGATLTGLSATIPAGADFSITSDGCSGKSLTAGANCSLQITFAPSVAGDRSSMLTVSASSAAMASDTLNGTGKARITVVVDKTWCNGTVTSGDGAINCGSTCGPADVTTSTITLNANPVDIPGANGLMAIKCHFDGWSEAGCSGTGECVVTMNGDKTLHGAFSPKACVDPAGGSDSAAGTCSAPFKTITHAIQSLGSATGETVQLKPGTYSAATNSETFPITLPSHTRLLGDEAHKGQGPAPVIVRGVGDGGPHGMLTVSSGSQVIIAGLNLVENDVSSPDQWVIRAESSSSVSVRNNTIAPVSTPAQGATGVSLDGCTGCDVVGNVITGFGDGIFAASCADVAVGSNVIRYNGHGVSVWDLSGAGNFGVDLGGGQERTKPTGNNLLSCNTTDLWVAVEDSPRTDMAASGNTWDHSPPRLCPPNTNDCDIQVVAGSMEVISYVDYINSLTPPSDFCD